MESLVFQIGLIGLLIILNAVFASAEIAMVSSQRSRLELMAEKGRKGAAAVLRLIEDPSRYLAAIQVGVTLAGFLASASGAVALALPLQGVLDQVPLPLIAANAQGFAVVTITVLIAILSLIFGELVPKRLALHSAESIAVAVGRPMEFFSRVTGPLLFFLTTATNLTLRLLGFPPESPVDRLNEDEIRRIIAHQSNLDGYEKQLLSEVFEFGDAVLYDVMVPRTEVVAVPAGTTVRETIRIMTETGHSRIPIFKHSVDEIIGFASVKDLVPYLLNNRDSENVEQAARQAYFVPDTIPISRLLPRMQERKSSMAIAIDEFGGTSGIVTVETLVERIVGEIWDEYDTEGPDIVMLDDGQAAVKGLAEVEEVNRQLEIAIPLREYYNTVGGFVLDHLQRIPQPGARIELKDAVVEITRMRGNRILQVVIRRMRAENGGEGS